MRISKNEYYVMEIIWANRGNAPANEISKALNRQLSWAKTTVYTIINRLIDKKAISRTDPGFICTALCDKNEIRKQQANDIIGRLFDGSLSIFIDEYLKDQNLSDREKNELKRIMKKHLE